MFLQVKIKKKKRLFFQAVVKEMIGRKKNRREDITGFEGGARGPLAKECGQPPEAGKKQGYRPSLRASRRNAAPPKA